MVKYHSVYYFIVKNQCNEYLSMTTAQYFKAKTDPFQHQSISVTIQGACSI